MTDEQIVKAWECCKQDKCPGEECPLFDEEYCKKKLDDETLDLLQRQQTEIKTLDESNAVLFSDLAQAKEDFANMLAKYNAAMAQLGKVRHILAEKCKELDAAKKKVKHGEWFVAECTEHLIVTCSVCRENYYVHKKGQYRIEQSNYCPHCGAEMNGGTGYDRV